MTDPKPAYRAARQAWEEGDLRHARSLYEDAIAADPTFPLSHYDFAALVTREDPELARWHYRRFIELAKSDARLADMVATARHEMGKPRVKPPPPKPRPAATAKEQTSIVDLLWLSLWLIVAIVIVSNLFLS